PRRDHGLIRHGFGCDAALAESGEDFGDVFAFDFERDDIARAGRIRNRFRFHPFLRPRKLPVNDAQFALSDAARQMSNQRRRAPIEYLSAFIEPDRFKPLRRLDGDLDAAPARRVKAVAFEPGFDVNAHSSEQRQKGPRQKIEWRREWI